MSIDRMTTLTVSAAPTQSQRMIMTPYQQINDIREEENLVDNLGRLKKKYTLYKTENRQVHHRVHNHNHNQTHNQNQGQGQGQGQYQNHDDITFLLNERDMTITELKSQIDSLNQKLITLTIIYNEKIEDLKTEHKKELHRLFSEFVKRTNKIN